jgi:FixJ family two-component response regulator
MTFFMVLSETRGETPRVGQQPLVCVVDDDTAMLRALRRLIGISGFSVETFASAEQFLESRPSRTIDCLVVDVHLGGVSGLDLQEGLARSGASIPVIFITAYDDGPTRERARRSGAVEYLTKPFDEGALIDAIHRAIGRT